MFNDRKHMHHYAGNRSELDRKPSCYGLLHLAVITVVTALVAGTILYLIMMLIGG